MKIGFIGCGNMASAMISGMLKKGLYKKDEIIVSNLTEEGSKRSREKLGVVTTLDNHEVVKNTKLVFLAVKPQFYEEVLNEVKDELTPEHTVVGIAPGKTLAWLEEKCGQPLKVVRMMPNTPAQVGEGMTGVCANEKVSAEELCSEISMAPGTIAFKTGYLTIDAKNFKLSKDGTAEFSGNITGGSININDRFVVSETGSNEN
mgnify:CR=1 FL=1